MTYARPFNEEIFISAKKINNSYNHHNYDNHMC